MNLTDQELNLAMCEWMGWEKAETGLWYLFGAVSDDGLPGHYDTELPDYLSDDSPRRLLNEAEARLTEDEWQRYSRALNHMACRITCGNKGLCGYTISANARQRTIAILQTVKPEIFQSPKQ